MVKRNLVFLLAGVLLLIVGLVTGCGGSSGGDTGDAEGKKSSQAKIVPIYTPPSGGAAYILGGGIANIVNKELDDVQLVAESTSGSVEMVKLVSERYKNNADAFAIIASDGAYNGYNGKNEFDQAYSELKAVSYIYGAEVYLVVSAESPIKSYADLKSKRVGVGAPGSTLSSMATMLIEECYGIARNEYKPLPLSYGEVVQGIKDGSIDAGFLAGAAPMASYNELSSSKDVRIIPVDEEVIQKVVKDYPYYYRSLVKAGTYKNINKDIPILAFGVIILTHEKTDENLVYNLLKTVVDKNADLVAVHKVAKQMQPDSLLNGIGIPLHPGVQKYMDEHGIKKQ